MSSSVKVLGGLEGPKGVCVEGCFLDAEILFFEHIVSLCLLLGELSSLIFRVITESCLFCYFVEFVCLVGNWLVFVDTNPRCLGREDIT